MLIINFVNPIIIYNKLSEIWIIKHRGVHFPRPKVLKVVADRLQLISPTIQIKLQTSLNPELSAKVNKASG